MISVYCLKNPIDDKVFYVGVTKKNLSDRLKQHFTEKGNTRKFWLINEIICCGRVPLIEHLEDATLSDVDALERKWYDIFVEQGLEMLQTTRFAYSKNKQNSYSVESDYGDDLAQVRLTLPNDVKGVFVKMSKAEGVGLKPFLEKFFIEYSKTKK